MQPSEGAPAPLDGPGTKVADPRELLVGYLDWYRETLMRKLDGLSEAQLRTPVDPLGWSPLGLVKHLGWVERRWMRWGFAAEDVVAGRRAVTPRSGARTSRPTTSWPPTTPRCGGRGS